MIRINLLAAERPTEKKRASTVSAAPGAFQAYIFLVLFGGGALVLCAGTWWLKRAAIKDLDGKILTAEKRQKELQVIKSQVEAFERKKALLDAKVKLIEKLKSQQSAPVHTLDEISKALPEYVWLDNMESAGTTIRLGGQANSLTSVADFIANLQRSGWFPKVELNESTEDKGIVKFRLTADFQNVAAEANKPASQPPSAAAPAAPRS
jgi:type IV pilus assembly protein PilN